jgi:hypothetical protein
MTFWNIILILYIVFAVVYFGMNVMVAICAKDKLRREYANYTAHNTLGLGTRMCGVLRSILFALCPIVNAFFTIILLFTFDKVVDEVLHNCLNSWLELTPKNEVEE